MLQAVEDNCSTILRPPATRSTKFGMEKTLIEIAAEIKLLSNSAYCLEQEVYVTSKQLILMRKWLVKIRQNPKSNAAQFARFVNDVASPSSRISTLVSELFPEYCPMNLQELRAKLVESGISTDMETTDEFSADQISEAVAIWTGYRTSTFPVRDHAALASLFSAEQVVKLLPILSSLENDFYRSTAYASAKNLGEMAELAANDFRVLHPELPEAVSSALAWCYTYDFK